ncbi:DUF4974 domain-containing protein [Exilibacterium tricleocarpae]|uniref:DUF4974 domain-containing protein n=1 Tax=Exilibacterium tricleocarpae TaxID=2591008 RepID=A0A545SPU2_9GAMM|nr:FecR domain-containing protein [Exilibacterium tricleocarpae]TQV66981.1 DUF4974 domain-containing protein [Exilibacterium tricleocarpae]
MTDIGAQKINKEACAWIAKLHGAAPSRQEREDLRAWIAQSSAHQSEIRRVAKLWGELDVLTELAVAVEAPAKKARWNVGGLSLLLHHRVLIGAVGCAALGLMAILFIPFKSANPAQQVVYTTMVGEQQLITLDDGSTVLLNTNSQATVDYTSAARTIYLDRGQAHFDVTSNPARPFRVFADRGMVRAVGTAFSVYLKGTLMEVTVTEGAVELSAVDKPVVDSKTLFGTSTVAGVEKLVVVKAGQNVTFDQQVKAIESMETVDATAISRKLSWREGLLKFSGAPLHDVVEEISRYTDISIVILDPGIRDLRIGGLFSVGEVEKMFEALEFSFGVRVDRINENLVHLAAATPDTPSQ